jgi:hypothetical protein
MVYINYSLLDVHINFLYISHRDISYGGHKQLGVIDIKKLIFKHNINNLNI